MYLHIELRRLKDNLTYRFHRATHRDGNVGYKRDDQDIWIVQLPTHDWVVIDARTNTITGHPCDAGPTDHSDNPPEGTWISNKGGKSYVYVLRYVACGRGAP